MRKIFKNVRRSLGNVRLRNKVDDDDYDGEYYSDDDDRSSLNSGEYSSVPTFNSPSQSDVSSPLSSNTSICASVHAESEYGSHGEDDDDESFTAADEITSKSSSKVQTTLSSITSAHKHEHIKAATSSTSDDSSISCSYRSRLDNNESLYSSESSDDETRDEHDDYDDDDCDDDDDDDDLDLDVDKNLQETHNVRNRRLSLPNRNRALFSSLRKKNRGKSTKPKKENNSSGNSRIAAEVRSNKGRKSKAIKSKKASIFQSDGRDAEQSEQQTEDDLKVNSKVTVPSLPEKKRGFFLLRKNSKVAIPFSGDCDRQNEGTDDERARTMEKNLGFFAKKMGKQKNVAVLDSNVFNAGDDTNTFKEKLTMRLRKDVDDDTDDDVVGPYDNDRDDCTDSNDIVRSRDPPAGKDLCDDPENRHSSSYLDTLHAAGYKTCRSFCTKESWSYDGQEEFERYNTEELIEELKYKEVESAIDPDQGLATPFSVGNTYTIAVDDNDKYGLVSPDANQGMVEAKEKMHIVHSESFRESEGNKTSPTRDNHVQVLTKEEDDNKLEPTGDHLALTQVASEVKEDDPSISSFPVIEPASPSQYDENKTIQTGPVIPVELVGGLKSMPSKSEITFSSLFTKANEFKFAMPEITIVGKKGSTNSLMERSNTNQEPLETGRKSKFTFSAFATQSNLEYHPPENKARLEEQKQTNTVVKDSKKLKTSRLKTIDTLPLSSTDKDPSTEVPKTITSILLERNGPESKQNSMLSPLTALVESVGRDIFGSTNREPDFDIRSDSYATGPMPYPSANAAKPDIQTKTVGPMDSFCQYSVSALPSPVVLTNKNDQQASLRDPPRALQVSSLKESLVSNKKPSPSAELVVKGLLTNQTESKGTATLHTAPGTVRKREIIYPPTGRSATHERPTSVPKSMRSYILPTTSSNRDPVDLDLYKDALSMEAASVVDHALERHRYRRKTEGKKKTASTIASRALPKKDKELIKNNVPSTKLENDVVSRKQTNNRSNKPSEHDTSQKPEIQGQITPDPNAESSQELKPLNLQPTNSQNIILISSPRQTKFMEEDASKNLDKNSAVTESVANKTVGQSEISAAKDKYSVEAPVVSVTMSRLKRVFERKKQQLKDRTTSKKYSMTSWGAKSDQPPTDPKAVTGISSTNLFAIPCMNASKKGTNSVCQENANCKLPNKEFDDRFDEWDCNASQQNESLVLITQKSISKEPKVPEEPINSVPSAAEGTAVSNHTPNDSVQHCIEVTIHSDVPVLIPPRKKNKSFFPLFRKQKEVAEKALEDRAVDIIVEGGKKEWIPFIESESAGLTEINERKVSKSIEDDLESVSMPIIELNQRETKEERSSSAVATQLIDKHESITLVPFRFLLQLISKEYTNSTAKQELLCEEIKRQSQAPEDKIHNAKKRLGNFIKRNQLANENNKMLLSPTAFGALADVLTSNSTYGTSDLEGLLSDRLTPGATTLTNKIKSPLVRPTLGLVDYWVPVRVEMLAKLVSCGNKEEIKDVIKEQLETEEANFDEQEASIVPLSHAYSMLTVRGITNVAFDTTTGEVEVTLTQKPPESTNEKLPSIPPVQSLRIVSIFDEPNTAELGPQKPPQSNEQLDSLFVTSIYDGASLIEMVKRNSKDSSPSSSKERTPPIFDRIKQSNISNLQIVNLQNAAERDPIDYTNGQLLGTKTHTSAKPLQHQKDSDDRIQRSHQQTETTKNDKLKNDHIPTDSNGLKPSEVFYMSGINERMQTLLEDENPPPIAKRSFDLFELPIRQHDNGIPAQLYMKDDDMFDGSTLTFSRKHRDGGDNSTIDSWSIGASAWKDIYEASQVVEKALKRFDATGSKSEGGMISKSITERPTSIITDESMDEVEMALALLKTHAKRLGVKESDLLLAVKTEEEDGGTFDGLEFEQEDDRSLTLGEEILEAFKMYGFFGGQTNNNVK